MNTNPSIEIPEEFMNYFVNILRFQFGNSFANAFMKRFSNLMFSFSKKTGKLRQVFENKNLLFSYRPQFGTFTLTLYCALHILPLLQKPLRRIVVNDAISSFIKEGKSVLAKHVVDYDPSLLIGDEVIVVDSQDNLLAIGNLALPILYLEKQYPDGVAVKIRKGINKL